MSFIGINIGAITVKLVSLDGSEVCARVLNHHGRPLEVLNDLLGEFPAGAFFGVSGYLGHISEVAATQKALEHVNGGFDAVASLGGENFAVYRCDGPRIAGVISHNKCAAGSGEFFVQQVGRLGLTLSEAIERSFAGRRVMLATRCSVHCKSDITHKLNRREAALEDILHTLAEGMADKVVSLLEKGRRTVKRLLVVGGVAQNRAVITCLGDKLPNVEVVVLPESPFFEALGTALLTRAAPGHDSPQLLYKCTFESRPPLGERSGQVTFIPARPDDSCSGPFVLGVDAGSTTTKAVLLDPRTRQVVASHYGRTNGDPVEAARECLRALIARAGRCEVSCLAATGSGRELVGAYLQTPHVYNEISAHASGAAEFDPGVDTIFEIGGQDSKYILLRNGVPVDYAMNAACSAGTGSFLEECAQGDLGLPLAAIADAAMRAEAPVQFKTTCAAFINSDIRTALQEGASPDNVVAGLVYSVVQNYLEKVKGPRAVGQNIFLQGGVALNRAVAHAFAQCLQKPIVVPPHPELLGAIGAALLAMKRTQDAAPELRDLETLAAPNMELLGQFTCRACDNSCTISRFEVAGRRYPFGGRCSLFEGAQARGRRPAAFADSIEARNRLALRPAPATEHATGRRIGIPRALTAHSLYPLYATFFSGLGFEVVLSEVDPTGYARANSGFCFPAQIAHGAVQDLLNRGIDTVFVPHVLRMPNAHASPDSYICPITQASPYYLPKAFSGATFLSPVLDFGRGLETCRALADLAVRELGIARPVADQAYQRAVAAQVDAEKSLLRLGSEALAAALAEGKPAVILVGRSYNAYPAEASLSVARKLFSMGVRVVPGDCLPQDGPGRTVWHYPNLILNAAQLARRHENLFLLYVSNFSCTIDAFAGEMLASEMDDKPYLLLEIDAHTADAGIQTRLEAFLEIIRSYQSPRTAGRSFAPATIGPEGTVTTSGGRKLALRDPRVRLSFPAFSYYHSRAVALAARWLGLNTGPAIDLDRGQLERGLRYTSGRECLPFPVCIGQMLEAHENRAPDEVVGFYMARGGAPCVVTCYADQMQQFIRRQELENLFIFDPRKANDYCGLSARKLEQCLTPLVTLADLFVEMEQTLRAVAGPASTALIRKYWDEQVSASASLAALERGLETLIDRLAAIAPVPSARAPRVIVVGDFFTRFNPAFMEGVHDRYTQHGIVLIPAGLNELFLYAAYSEMVATSRDWAAPFESLREAALARLRVIRDGGLNYLISRLEYFRLRRCEERYRALFRRTGLGIADPPDMRSLFLRASQHISPDLFGEAVPTVGRGVAAGGEGFRGIIVIGPFNCLPFRISEAILKPFGVENGIPIITYESDGVSVSPAFLREVDVHIQQVLNRR